MTYGKAQEKNIPADSDSNKAYNVKSNFLSKLSVFLSSMRRFPKKTSLGVHSLKQHKSTTINNNKPIMCFYYLSSYQQFWVNSIIFSPLLRKTCSTFPGQQ